MDDRGSRVIGNHLKKILPGFAIYKALVTAGESEEASISFVRDNAAYSPLSPAVEFIRHGTLAETKTKCDFCFKRGLCS